MMGGWESGGWQTPIHIHRNTHVNAYASARKMHARTASRGEEAVSEMEMLNGVNEAGITYLYRVSGGERDDVSRRMRHFACVRDMDRTERSDGAGGETLGNASRALPPPADSALALTQLCCTALALSLSVCVFREIRGDDFSRFGFRV